jgi:hypothetical protein
VLQAFNARNLDFSNHFTSEFRVELDRGVGEAQCVPGTGWSVGPTGLSKRPMQANRRLHTGELLPGRAPAPGSHRGPLAAPLAILCAQVSSRQLFPDVPLLFTAVDDRYLAIPRRRRRMRLAVFLPATILPWSSMNYPPGACPRPARCSCVIGSGRDQQILAGSGSRRTSVLFFTSAASFVWSAESVPGMKSSIAARHLPANSAILLPDLRNRRGQDRPYADEHVIGEPHARGQCSIVWLRHSPSSGSGIVGGPPPRGVDWTISAPQCGELGDFTNLQWRSEPTSSVKISQSQLPSLLGDSSWSRNLRPMEHPREPAYQPESEVAAFDAPRLWMAYRNMRGAGRPLGALAIQAALILGLLFDATRTCYSLEIESRRTSHARRRHRPRMTMSTAHGLDRT